MSQFFLFQIGPVQEFIAQARSTRDLWSGSYLISWLVARAIEATEAEGGTIVFPATQQQPLFQWLREKDRQKRRELNQAHVLTPSLPNRFLAEVPEGFDPKVPEKALQDEWLSIQESCWAWLHGRVPFRAANARERWNFQVKHQWQITWQLWPKHAWSEAKPLWEALPQRAAKAGAAPRTFDGATDEDKAWVADYELLVHRLDARRQLRNFEAWAAPENSRLLDKDAFSGREEAFGRDWGQSDRANWFEDASKSDRLGYLFRSQEPLGAINLIKRVWHLAYLREKRGLSGAPAELAFESVPAVAAASWRSRVLDLTGQRAEVAAAAATLLRQAGAARHPLGIAAPGSFEKVDGSIFHEAAWRPRKDAAPSDRALLEVGLQSLRALRRTAGLESAPGYYAVLAMDGDSMGKWIGGEMTGRASARFHREFSAALSSFGVAEARRIVEEEHQGALIYSGGDDVLALLPAARAIACARALSEAFGKAIRLAEERMEDPGFRFPLATVSVGLALGHMKEPLQDMVAAAQAAERRAKNQPLSRNALSLTVFKRSGEMIEWGAKFDSPAFALHALFADSYRARLEDPAWKPPISGRFPHQLAALLRPYETCASTHGFPDSARPEPLAADFVQVVLREFAHVTGQQARGLNDQPETAPIPARLHALASAYLTELAQANGSDGENAGSLRDFYNLFLVEAFLNRQLES